MTNYEYTSCDWVTSGIHFFHNRVRFCCYEYLHSPNENIIIPDYKGEKIDYEKFFEIKNKYRELAKSGNIHQNCKNCIYLSSANWSDDDYFDHFTFNYWSNCNSKCIYCYTKDLAEKDKRQYYEVYPIIKDMSKKGLLRATPRNCVVFGGGEPTILKEFDKLVDLFIQEGFNNIRVNSSGIKYSKTLEKGLKNNSVSLVISPDCGSKDTYLKIKRVNCFDKVWDNIKEYAKKQGNENNLKVKYILLPEINDNKEEIDKWFDMVLKSGVKSVSVSVEQEWYAKHHPNFPQYIYDSLHYICDKADRLNLNMEVYCEAISVLELEK